jgi:hypothetical protein
MRLHLSTPPLRNIQAINNTYFHLPCHKHTHTTPTPPKTAFLPSQAAAPSRLPFPPLISLPPLLDSSNSLLPPILLILRQHPFPFCSHTRPTQPLSPLILLRRDHLTAPVHPSQFRVVRTRPLLLLVLDVSPIEAALVAQDYFMLAGVVGEDGGAHFGRDGEWWVDGYGVCFWVIHCVGDVMLGCRFSGSGWGG